MADLVYKIEKHIADLSEPSAKGWKKELNLVKWGENDPKYDIRAWNEDHTKSGKGLTFTTEELTTLKGVLSGLDVE